MEGCFRQYELCCKRLLSQIAGLSAWRQYFGRTTIVLGVRDGQQECLGTDNYLISSIRYKGHGEEAAVRFDPSQHALITAATMAERAYLGT